MSHEIFLSIFSTAVDLKGGSIGTINFYLGRPQQRKQKSNQIIEYRIKHFIIIVEGKPNISWVYSGNSFGSHSHPLTLLSDSTGMYRDEMDMKEVGSEI